MVNFRMDDDTVGRLWTSAVAVGRQHGLELHVFGERGGISWVQEHPEQLCWTPVGGRTEIIERGEEWMAADAAGASRIAVGHVEGMPLAFANIYRDLACMIREGGPIDATGTRPIPTAEDGLHSMQAVRAAVASAGMNGQWVDLP